MRKFSYLSAILLAALIAIVPRAYAQKETVKVTDLLKIKSVGEVHLNKDGTKAVFTLTSIEPDAASKWDFKYVTHLYIVPTDASTPPRALTAKESASQPAWSS